jgi:hypothetical protein
VGRICCHAAIIWKQHCVKVGFTTGVWNCITVF